MHRSLLIPAGALLLLACGDAARPAAFTFHGMAPGMNAAELRAAASGAGIGAMECQPLAVAGLAADQLCFTPDSSASTVNVSAMVQSADSMVSYLAIREGMLNPGVAYDALTKAWGTPDTAIATGRRWRRGRWVASADTGEGILTVWLSDSVTDRVVALASQREQLKAAGADTLPYQADMEAVVNQLRSDTAGGGAPHLASDLRERPSVISCQPVQPPADLAGRTGYVVLAYLVDTAGGVEPRSVRVLQATHAGLGPAAAASVRTCRLRPGRLDGRPVRTLVQQRVTFRPSK